MGWIDRASSLYIALLVDQKRALREIRWIRRHWAYSRTEVGRLMREMKEPGFRLRTLAWRRSTRAWKIEFWLGIAYEGLRLMLALISDITLVKQEFRPFLLTLGAFFIVAVMTYVVNLWRSARAIRRAKYRKALIVEWTRRAQGVVPDRKTWRAQYERVWDSIIREMQPEFGIDNAHRLFRKTADEAAHGYTNRELIAALFDLHDRVVLPVLTDYPQMHKTVVPPTDAKSGD